MPNRSVSDPHELVELAFEEPGEGVISKTSREIGDSQEGKENFTEAFSSIGEYSSSSGQGQISSEPSFNCGASDSVSLRAELIPNEGKTNSEKFESGSPGSEPLPKEVYSGSEELDPGLPGSDQIPNKFQSNFDESGLDSPGSDQFLNEVHSDSGKSGLGSPGSASTLSSLHNGSMMQSPAVQVMERPDETSTYRIPSHVFARSKSGTPAEWSVASNESLFSLHVGNNSFSGDHIFLMAVEGGLGVEEAAAETMNVVLKAAAEDRDKAKVLPVEETPKSCSHGSSYGSRDNMQSFSFPILTGNGGTGSLKVRPEQDEPKHKVHSQRPEQDELKHKVHSQRLEQDEPKHKVHSQSVQPSRAACYPMWCTACYPISMWRSWLPRCRLRCWRV